jgi:hypothetical protein
LLSLVSMMTMSVLLSFSSNSLRFCLNLLWNLASQTTYLRANSVHKLIINGIYALVANIADELSTCSISYTMGIVCLCFFVLDVLGDLHILWFLIWLSRNLISSLKSGSNEVIDRTSQKDDSLCVVCSSASIYVDSICDCLRV